MCGLYGYVTFNSHGGGLTRAQRHSLLLSLGLLNIKRGGHAWGVASVLPGGSVFVRKDKGASPPPNVARSIAAAHAVMGHTRWATHGDNTPRNAHPHSAGAVTLSHNGVIQSHTWANRKYDRACEVDSMHLAMHLNEHKPLSDLDGYGVISWHDRREPDKVWLLNMGGGTISAAEGDWGVAWSSERDHLEMSLDYSRAEVRRWVRLDRGEPLFVLLTAPAGGWMTHGRDKRWELGSVSYAGYKNRAGIYSTSSSCGTSSSGYAVLGGGRSESFLDDWELSDRSGGTAKASETALAQSLLAEQFREGAAIPAVPGDEDQTDELVRVVEDGPPPPRAVCMRRDSDGDTWDLCNDCRATCTQVYGIGNLIWYASSIERPCQLCELLGGPAIATDLTYLPDFNDSDHDRTPSHSLGGWAQD